MITQNYRTKQVTQNIVKEHPYFEDKNVKSFEDDKAGVDTFRIIVEDKRRENGKAYYIVAVKRQKIGTDREGNTVFLYKIMKIGKVKRNDRHYSILAGDKFNKNIETVYRIDEKEYRKERSELIKKFRNI